MARLMTRGALLALLVVWAVACGGDGGSADPDVGGDGGGDAGGDIGGDAGDVEDDGDGGGPLPEARDFASLAAELVPDDAAQQVRLLRSVRAVEGAPVVPVHPIPGARAGDVADETTIVSLGAAMIVLSPDQAEQVSDTFVCGQGEDRYVFCADTETQKQVEAGELEAGPYVTAWFQLRGRFPLQTDKHYQYGIVFDRDGDASNNYLPGDDGGFIGARDFFYNTDFWVTLDHTPGDGWRIQVRDARGGVIQSVSSRARVIATPLYPEGLPGGLPEEVDFSIGTHLTVLIPALEFDTDGQPVGFRATAHCHEGDFGVEDPWSGAVEPAPPELDDTSLGLLESIDVQPEEALTGPDDQHLLPVGYSIQYSASGTHVSDDERFSPLYTRLVDWSSAATTVATVDEAGLVTAVGPGTTTITATHPLTGVAGAATLTVLDCLPEGVAITPSHASVPIGAEVDLSIDAAQCGVLSGLRLPVSSFDLTPSASGIQAVPGEPGRFLAMSAGEVTVTASHEATGAEAEVTVAVTDDLLSQIEIVNELGCSDPLVAGLTCDFKVQGTWTDGFTQDVTHRATWSDDDEELAFVGGQGTVVGTAERPVSVLAFLDEFEDSHTIDVVDDTLTGVSILTFLEPDEELLFVPLGLPLDLGASGQFQDSGEVGGLDDSLTWTSSERTVGVISNVAGVAGTFVPLAPGFTTITIEPGPFVREAAFDLRDTLTLQVVLPERERGLTETQPGPFAAPLTARLDELIAEPEVVDGSDQLAAIQTYYSLVYPDAVLYVELEAGWIEGGVHIEVPDTVASGLLFGSESLYDADGHYTIVSVAASDESCGVTALTAEPAAEPEVKQGICGTLSVAHSLVENLQIVNRDWAGVRDGANWDPEFLRDIDAIGDGQRGTSYEDLDEAHIADWNPSFPVDRSAFQDYVDPQSCEDLRAFCEALERWVEAEQDDCVLLLWRPDDDAGEGAAHAEPVHHSRGQGITPAVTYSEPTGGCQCDIRTVNTGWQDAADDYAGIPTAPGLHTWRLRPNLSTVVDGPSMEFWHAQRYSRFGFRCYDEGLAPGVGPSDPGSPGSAFGE